MHWNQIKTLLILSFLVLNIYLFIEFMEKKQEQDYSILEQDKSSIEETLRTESIRVKNLPDKEYEETFITVTQKRFTDDDLAAVKKLSKQVPFLFDEYLIGSKMIDKVSVPSDLNKEKAKEIVSDIVYGPEEYTFWNWNEELNVLVYFQDKMDRPVYYNQNALVLLFLNEDNDVTYYLQTMLGDTESQSESRQLIKPIRAIEILYGANELQSNDEIESVNIGFHTRLPFESGVQVFVPIWKVNVNKEKNFFVNAIEGFTFSTEEEEFLYETIEAAVERMNDSKENAKELNSIKKDLELRVEHLYKGESE